MRYRIEFGQSKVNRIKAQKFRQKVFRACDTGLDEDNFDKISDHCLIFDQNNNDKLVLVFRSRSYSNMKEILCSYSAQYYNLTKLTRLRFKPLEIGRLCVDNKAEDPFLLVTAFKFLASIVSNSRTDFIFGCTSFSGLDNPRHLASLSSLNKNQLARSEFQIKKKANDILDIKKIVGQDKYKRAKIFLPPLLKFYLRLGGKVSDHAVVDRDLDTLHVFTYLDLNGRKIC